MIESILTDLNSNSPRSLQKTTPRTQGTHGYLGVGAVPEPTFWGFVHNHQVLNELELLISTLVSVYNAKKLDVSLTPIFLKSWNHLRHHY